MSNEVIIKNAVKRYGDFTALHGVSLNIEKGEFFISVSISADVYPRMITEAISIRAS